MGKEMAYIILSFVILLFCSDKRKKQEESLSPPPPPLPERPQPHVNFDRNHQQEYGKAL